MLPTLKICLKSRKSDNKDFVRDLKNNPCTDCGQVFITEAMEFDHIDGEKRNQISRMVGNPRTSKNKQKQAKTSKNKQKQAKTCLNENLLNVSLFVPIVIVLEQYDVRSSMTRLFTVVSFLLSSTLILGVSLLLFSLVCSNSFSTFFLTRGNNVAALQPKYYIRSYDYAEY